MTKSQYPPLNFRLYPYFLYGVMFIYIYLLFFTLNQAHAHIKIERRVYSIYKEVEGHTGNNTLGPGISYYKNILERKLCTLAAMK